MFEINRKFDSKTSSDSDCQYPHEGDQGRAGQDGGSVVSRDRLYLIDAILVRILKAHKTILPQALIPQVLEQIKVPAQASDIKQRIESLIEREYMERDAQDRSQLSGLVGKYMKKYSHY